MSKIISIVLVIGFMMFVCSDLLAAEADDAEMRQSFQAPMFTQTYLLRVNDVENRNPMYERPPLSAGRIAGEIIAGGAGGVCGIAVGGSILSLGQLDLDEFVPVLIGIGIVYIAGSAYGVYEVGNIGDETGSFSAAFGGGFLGMGVGIASFCLFAYMENPIAIMVGFSVLLAAPPIGATIGFNKTRRYKSPPETALIDFKDGQMRLAVPTMYSQPNSFGEITQRVDLLKVRF